MTLSLVKEKNNGLVIDNDNRVSMIKTMGIEGYEVIFRGVKAAFFMSAPAANTKLIQLLNKTRG